MTFKYSTCQTENTLKWKSLCETQQINIWGLITTGSVTLVLVCVWVCVRVCVRARACTCVAFNDNAAYHNEGGCSWTEASGFTLLKVISANATVFAICWDCLHLPR